VDITSSNHLILFTIDTLPQREKANAGTIWANKLAMDRTGYAHAFHYRAGPRAHRTRDCLRRATVATFLAARRRFTPHRTSAWDMTFPLLPAWTT